MTTYTYEVKGSVDMTGVNSAYWANTPLKDQCTIYAQLEMTNPINVGVFNYGGVYVPDSLYLDIEGVEHKDAGSQFANGGNWADVTVLNHPTGFWQGDGLFLNIEPRAIPGLPFGDIGKFSFRLWLDNDSLRSIDPPTDASFMQNWPSMAHPSKVEWHFLNPGGIGSGFSWGVSPITHAAAGVTVS